MERTLTVGSTSLSRIRQKEYWRDLVFFLKGFWLLFFLFCFVVVCREENTRLEEVGVGKGDEGWGVGWWI